MRRPARGCPLCRTHPEDCRAAATFEGGAAMATYHITLRDRETQTVVGYYNGAWTTDPRRSLALGRREAAEAHAARMRTIAVRATPTSSRSRSLPPPTKDFSRPLANNRRCARHPQNCIRRLGRCREYRQAGGNLWFARPHPRFRRDPQGTRQCVRVRAPRAASRQRQRADGDLFPLSSIGPRTPYSASYRAPVTVRHGGRPAGAAATVLAQRPRSVFVGAEVRLWHQA